MHPEHRVFKAEIPIGNPEAMKEFEKMMHEYEDEVIRACREEAQVLGISEGQMFDIYYLRSRSRWTQKREDELIQIAKSGGPWPAFSDL